MIKLRFFIVILLFWNSVFGQGIIQLQQTPMLISPCFTGSDTAARIIAAGQFVHQKYNDTERGKDRNNTNSAFLISYDKMFSGGKKAIGFYTSVEDNRVTDNRFMGGVTYMRLQAPVTDHWLNRSLKTRLIEFNVNYIPHFMSLKIDQKNYSLTPAISLNIAQGSAYENHRKNYEHNDSQDTVSFVNLAGGTTQKVYNNFKDTSLGYKNITFYRAGVAAACMFTSQRLFIAYQLKFLVDNFSLSYSDYSYDRFYDAKQGEWKENFKNRNDSYNTFSYQVLQVISFGANFPKRKNSLVQITPIAVISYNSSSLNASYRPLIDDEYYYYVNNLKYDYTNVFGFSGRNFSFNLRVGKILAGINTGQSNFYSTVTNYYLGYKAKKYTVTAGYFPNNIFNTSLKFLL
ncbi:MAG: hypothetical protein H7329_16750 [Opitutaceae bacterium]|nr:hypothetical protein [Cytophagales bacterium]